MNFVVRITFDCNFEGLLHLLGCFGKRLWLHRGRYRRYVVELVQGSGHIRAGYAHYVEMSTGPHQVYHRDGR